MVAPQIVCHDPTLCASLEPAHQACGGSTLVSNPDGQKDAKFPTDDPPVGFGRIRSRCKPLKQLEPARGIEPPTYALRMRRSTVELRRLSERHSWSDDYSGQSGQRAILAVIGSAILIRLSLIRLLGLLAVPRRSQRPVPSLPFPRPFRSSLWPGRTWIGWCRRAGFVDRHP